MFNTYIIFSISGSLSTYAPEPEFVGDIPSIKVIAGKDATLRCVVDNLGPHKVINYKAFLIFSKYQSY